ncbi:MAG: DUF922 domain-containing protein [Gemmatimonadaceae bacterium]
MQPTFLRLMLLAAAPASASCAAASGGGLDLGPSPIGVNVQSRVGYYDVSGATIPEIRSQVGAHGPTLRTRDSRRALAVTRHQMQWRYEYARDAPGGCQISDVKVRVDLAIIYPRWTPPATPDSVVSAWWGGLAARLKEHEEGHAILVLDSAGRIVRALRGMSGGSCDALGIRASRVAQRHYSEMRELQQRFDASNGAAQREMVAAVTSRKQ